MSTSMLEVINIATEKVFTVFADGKPEKGSIIFVNGLKYKVIGESKDGLLEVEKVV